MSVVLAATRKELLCCFPVVVQLRPHLTETQFLERAEQQAQEGYKLAFVEDAGRVVCVAGFRIMHNLAWGKFLYVDDLVTDEQERSKGFGQQLLAWLVQHGKDANCDAFHLDSGVQRFGAHRFYLASGMDITCHHFAMKLKP
jgi:GNAT superfamily N-acetyltransferase